MGRPGRASRVGAGFVLLGILLAGLLVVADRVLVHLTDSRVSAQLQAELDTPRAPDVSVEGFPFLTQLLGGSLRSVHIVADDIPAPDQRSSGLAHTDLRLRGVTSRDRFRSFTAQQVAGTATLDYPSAQRLVGYPLSYHPEGQVELTTQTTLGSSRVRATITGRPVVDAADQTLTLADPQVTVAGVAVPVAVSQALLGGLLKPVPITGIPYGLAIQDLRATSDGLVASLTGTDVTFSR